MYQLDSIIKKHINEAASHPIHQAILTRMETKLNVQLDVINGYLKELKDIDSRSQLDLLISDIDGTGQDLVQLAKNSKDYLRNNKLSSNF